MIDISDAENLTSVRTMAEVTNSGAVVIFTAPAWCQPCRQLEPHISKLEEMLSNHTFARVDLGGSPEESSTHWAMSEYNVRGVPSVKLMCGDSVIDIKARTVVGMKKEIESHG